MGYRLILAGLVFFANPCVNIIDFLPDFIGCILIYFGLRKLSDLEDRFHTAKIFAARFIPLYVLKAVLSVAFTVGDQRMRMPATFISGVIECIFFVVLFTNLFGGIEALATIYGGDRHLKKLGEVSQYAIIISVAKQVLSFIPEALSLFRDSQYSDFSSEVDFGTLLAQAKPWFSLLCIVGGSILGLWYLTIIIPYFRALWRDKPFCDSLRALYNEKITENTQLMTHRAFKAFTVLLLIGFAFMYDLTIEAVNILPDFIGYIILFCALCAVCDNHQRGRSALVAVPLFIVSVVSYLFKIYTTMGTNFRMDYDVYMRRASEIVDNGKAVYIGAALFALEAILLVLLTRQILMSADKKIRLAKDGVSVPVAMPTVVVGIFSVLSALCDIAPLLTARFYALYLADTTANAKYELLSERSYIFHNYVGLALIVFTAIVLVYFNKIKKHIDFEI